MGHPKDDPDFDRAENYPIDWDDPGQMTHQGKPIPINNPDKYGAAVGVVEALHYHRGIDPHRPTNKATGKLGNDETWPRLRSRILQGMTLKEIIEATNDELDERYPDTKPLRLEL